MSNKRIKGISMSRPFIYGNEAHIFGPNEKTSETPPDHTHSWTVFLRGVNGEDLSYYIRRVTFRLHETYPNFNRTIEKPPFQVTETGWGEFEIAIKVYFIPEANEKSVTLYHHLKLHPYGAQQQQNGGGSNNNNSITPAVPTPTPPSQPPKKVESVLYDEFVFNEPTEGLFNILATKPIKLAPHRTPSILFSQQTEQEELDRIGAGLDKVKKQTQQLRNQLDQLDSLKQNLATTKK